MTNVDNNDTTPRTPRDARAESLEVMLAEYNSLREECLQAIGYRIAVMNFSFGALAIVLAALLTSDMPALAIGSISVVFLPVASKAGLLIWFGEYNRSQRAGRWIRGLESRINERVGVEGCLGWETNLGGGVDSRHMGYPYVATVLFMLVTGYAGSVLGLYYLYQGINEMLPTRTSLLLVLLVLVLILVIETQFLRFFRREWRSTRGAN